MGNKKRDLRQIGTVSLNYRYVAAWSEVNARIGLRQNALTIYVTLSAAIITILATVPSDRFPIPTAAFALFLPLFSLFFGLLNYKHDMTIALLREYLRQCELKGYGEDQEFLPGYNSHSGFKAHAEKYRGLHDWAATLLILMFNILGAVVAYQSLGEVMPWHGWPVLGYVGAAAWSMFLVLKRHEPPMEIDTLRPDRQASATQE